MSWTTRLFTALAWTGLGCGLEIYPDAPQRDPKGAGPNTVQPATTDDGPPQPPPPPDPRHEPFVRPPLPEMPIDGKWRVSDFEVDIQPPAGAWLESYDRSFGLVLGFGPDDRFKTHSQITLRTNCGGRCVKEELEERIKNYEAERVFENTARERGVARVEWVEKARSVGVNRWWFHMTGFDEAGAKVIERAQMSAIDPASDGGWLLCSVRLEGAERSRLAEFAKFCRELPYRYVGRIEDTEAVEARFAGKYPMRGVLLDVATPEGMRFARYHPAQGFASLEFRGRMDTGFMNELTIKPSCAGSCVSHLLEKNLLEHEAERLAQLDEEGRPYEVQQPLAEIAPGRWRSRVRYPAREHWAESIEIRTVALREGVDEWLECRARLERDLLGQADAFEKRCLDTLAGW